MLNSLGYVKRKATTSRKLTDVQLLDTTTKAKAIEELITQYHPSLVLEMDETKLPWCPSDDFTY